MSLGPPGFCMPRAGRLLTRLADQHIELVRVPSAASRPRDSLVLQPVWSSLRPLSPPGPLRPHHEGSRGVLPRACARLAGSAWLSPGGARPTHAAWRGRAAWSPLRRCWHVVCVESFKPRCWEFWLDFNLGSECLCPVLPFSTSVHWLLTSEPSSGAAALPMPAGGCDSEQSQKSPQSSVARLGPRPPRAPCRVYLKTSHMCHC